jgi:hypothetical protein
MVSYKAYIHAGALQLLHADVRRLDKVALSVAAESYVFPIRLRSAERSDAEAQQAIKVLRKHAKAELEARCAWLSRAW